MADWFLVFVKKLAVFILVVKVKADQRRKDAILFSSHFENLWNEGGLNGVVVSVAECNPKRTGFDSRVMLGTFPLRKSGLRTLV
jgi:hypothetical protein